MLIKINMNKKIAESTVEKVIKALEDAGFIFVLTEETDTDRCYVMAESEGE